MFTDTYSPQINGVVTSINSFASELEKQGHKVFIFCPHVKGAKKKDNVFYFKSVKYPLHPEHQLAYSLSGHWKKFKDLQLDIIHSHTPFSLGILAVFLAKQYRIPIVHTYHTLFTEYVHYIPFGKFIGVWFSVNTSRRYCQKCDLVVVPSHSMRIELQRYGVTQEIDVIPTGIDDNFKETISAEVFKKKQKISPETDIIVYAGRLGKEKNIEFLLKVYREVLKVRHHVLFVIIGDGPHRKHIEKYAQDLGIYNKMLFTGYIYDKKLLANWLHAARVFAFSSLTETQGLVVLEAMAVGTPVVAVEAMGVADIIKDNVGGYASKQDVMEFSLKLMRILSSKTFREKKAKEAKNKAEDYRMAKLTKHLVNNYQRLIDVATKV